MYPAPIEEYVRPTTVEAALEAMARYDEGDAIFLAGGQSAMQAIKSRMLRPQCIVDLQAVPELRGITQPDGGLAIGAMTRYVEIAGSDALAPAFAALSDAAAHVGDRQVRNRGTIGGSVCWNYMAACTPAAVLGLGGRLELRSADDARTVAADDFFLGPLETARRDDEILVRVSWPAPAPNSGSAYAKWGLVRDALPVVGICISVTLDDGGRCIAARVALAGLANGAERAAAGEASLLGSDGNTESLATAMQAIADSATAHSDMSASADYRKQLICSLGAEVGARAFARAAGTTTD